MDGTGKFSRKSSLPETSFEVKMHQKWLAIGLRPDPLEEHSASPEPLTAIGGQGIEHSLAGIRGRCVDWTGREEQSRVVWEEWGGRIGRADVIIYSKPSLPVTSFSVQNVPKHFCGRALPRPTGGA